MIYQKGLSTLEMLIAMSIIILVIGYVLPLVSIGQTTSIDSTTNQEALYLAVDNIEKSRAELKSDFDTPVSADLGADPFYSPTLEVTDISPCSKGVESSVNWTVESRNLFSKILTIITSAGKASLLGVFCDPLPPKSSWDAPMSFNIFSPSNFEGQGTGVTVSYINGIRYAFLTTSSASKDNFYIINASNPQSAFIESSINIDKGLNDLIVVGDYAYVLKNDTENQLIVINVSNPSDPRTIEQDADNIGYTLPNMTAGENPIPTSISYYDQKIYIGTEYLAFGAPGENEELHVFDVSTPQTPAWQSSINVDRRINDIAARDNVAYLATGPGSNNTPLKIYDLSTGGLINEFLNINSWNGKSLYLLGNKLYFGLERRSTASNPEFYIFDVSNPWAPLIKLGSVALDNFTPAGSAAITGIAVQSNLAFLVTTDSNNERLYIMNIADPLNIVHINTCNTPPLPAAGTGIIYMDDYLFISLRSNEAFRIIYPSPICP